MKAIHMLRSANPDALTRETFCLRQSYGGGTGIQVLSFIGKGGSFDGTEIAGVVTCKRCLNRMRYPA